MPNFIQALKDLPNCHLRGALGTSELANEMKEMDAFLLTYRTHPTESDLSNSHKLLEYLSTGRVVIASPLSEYDEVAPDSSRSRCQGLEISEVNLFCSFRLLL